MATLDAVARLVLALPETTEVPANGGEREWRMRGKLFAWERPLRKNELRALGDRAPAGVILGVCVPDLETKDAMITARSDVFFTTPHFDGYAMVLVKLPKITVAELRDVLKEAWLARAPKMKAAKKKAAKKKRG